ncbi:hypothetical protein EIK76_17195 [Rheinheimera mesophila]|uniref:Uncharacterized protein n=1 Tax=Rheinheimera mesophila TaxID=1547515 RepID=A0A3P3QB99_9GAMM|nr:hypothetical protein [Rheinheimera mesophila]RRJ18492.1 hypothetical protein EIK76_17195 [Rheinheimera mesophila]
MKLWSKIKVMLCSLLLTGCFAPALLMTSQAQLLGELFRPLVGFNPLDVKLFENPLIRDPMVALMGEDNYRTAVTLLNTATAIQQQGPLYFVVSEHSPLPHLAEKAGFVWNSEHNQMAILLVSGGKTEIFNQVVEGAAGKIAPSWPKELVEYTSPEKLKQKVVAEAAGRIGQGLGLSEQQTGLVETGLSGGSVQNALEDNLKQQAMDPVEEIKQKVEAGKAKLLSVPKQRFTEMTQEAVPTEDDVIKQFTGKSADELKAAKKYVEDAKARADANQKQPVSTVKDQATLEKEAKQWAKDKANKKVDETRAPADELLNELTEEVKQKTTLPTPAPAKKKDGGE